MSRAKFGFVRPVAFPPPLPLQGCFATRTMSETLSDNTEWGRGGGDLGEFVTFLLFETFSDYTEVDVR